MCAYSGYSYTPKSIFFRFYWHGRKRKSGSCIFQVLHFQSPRIKVKHHNAKHCYDVTDFQAVYVSTSSTLLGANPAVAVPLLTISSWILMQRKVPAGSVSFNQLWIKYRKGFGTPTSSDNYWLGFDKVHRLQEFGNVRLRIEVTFGSVRDKKLSYRLETGRQQCISLVS